ncbi:hypothetical protein [Paenibacillus lentus]|uniref:Uncharacterized protein n=1 Tax=Paenibacillus lentus TaxID=1338368 RepID=A0A3S8RT88_9BACL|nr:hypothetical protein [Paenibacillus lentus]AZK46201.1 hypothetical protein EIM92_08450 [Paenibacillus lentus]
MTRFHEFIEEWTKISPCQASKDWLQQGGITGEAGIIIAKLVCAVARSSFVYGLPKRSINPNGRLA